LVTFLKKHRRLLTVAGALVLFVTYTVKEGLRDRVKDQLASLTAAQAQYTEASNHIEEMDAIDRIGDFSFSGDDNSFGDTAGDAWSNVEKTLFSQPYPGFGNADLLTKEMTDDRELLAKREQARNALLALDSFKQRAPKAFDREETGWEKKAQTNEQQQLSDQALKLPSQATELVDAYVSLASSRADQEHQKMQHRYEVFTNWSYGLFSLGWTLALVGKLLEPESEPLEVE
jgi:hypothetical protein